MTNFNQFSPFLQGLNAFVDCVDRETLAADKCGISSIIPREKAGDSGDSIEGAIARITREEWSAEASQVVDYWLWAKEQPVETLATLTLEGGRK